MKEVISRQYLKTREIAIAIQGKICIMSFRITLLAGMLAVGVGKIMSAVIFEERKLNARCAVSATS